MSYTEKDKELAKAIELNALGYVINYLRSWMQVFKNVEASECKTETERAYQRGRYDAFRMALDAAMRTQSEIINGGK